MRTLILLAALALVATSPASALLAEPPILAPFDIREANDGVRDGDVLLLMAQHRGLPVERLAPIPLASAADLPLALASLSTRAGAPLSEADAARAFATLHPSVAAPTATLLLAIDEAWTLRELAFARYTPEQEVALLNEPRVGPPLTPEEEAALVSAAILVTDTLDSVVLPALALVADLPIWPPIALSDPSGAILYIGSSGNDNTLASPILAIDGQGNDIYRGNVGGAGVDLTPQTIDRLVALAVDLQGDDVYDADDELNGIGYFGGGELGIGILYDLQGEDEYYCGGPCVGGAILGAGVMRDSQGNDYHRVGSYVMGAADLGIAYARDDSGNDAHFAIGSGFGYAVQAGFGLYWDRAGIDDYLASGSSVRVFGYANSPGDGWFIDEGPDNDRYWDLEGNRPFGRGRCNDCTWATPTFNAPRWMGGRGNDNSGGLPYMFSSQNTHPTLGQPI